MGFRQRHDFLHGGDLPVEMDGKNGFGLWGNSGRGLFRAQVERGLIRLNQNRLQPVFGNGQDAGNVGIGRDDDLITFLQPAQLLPGPQGQRQCIQTVGNANAMLCAAIVGKFPFKGLNLLALNIPARVNHTGGRFNQFITVLLIDGF